MVCSLRMFVQRSCRIFRQDLLEANPEFRSVILETESGLHGYITAVDVMAVLFYSRLTKQQVEVKCVIRSRTLACSIPRGGARDSQRIPKRRLRSPECGGTATSTCAAKDSRRAGTGCGVRR